ncbi:MAG: hypothetical protein EXX96DRAFT_58118 [Benjaminiella poitrasii]|nr:MAG: hypothetical protein EXX96DRAFT_58118 [Benjaminiella poitrasii]
MIFIVSPLRSVEIISFGNVLSTQKQLFVDLFVQASNSNGFSVQISHGVISLFAASHYVPVMNTINKSQEYIFSDYNTSSDVAPHVKQEYLGTFNSLETPLLFEASPLFYFKSKSSVSKSQIQIKNPGETKGDMSGNERWSLLIRYPYELTIRGILRYQLFPFIHTKLYSVRICKVMQVDPVNGMVTEVPSEENSICDETEE